MKEYILSAIREGTEIIEGDYNSEYKNKVNESIQLLLQALKIIQDDDN